ncbi:hypothetical protein WKR88_15800 [Trinickia caryophylli]|uniref:Uncharacterized protein n=1 Tax=Trinickia caryophylli TaxID=28094 RepID=A0A1X7D2R3_TRICW|nr:hypothetical protein [Trinickia caryophylli]PMS12787.1 hypothetical protein C0Z17_08205 [Trinickia caryophylli]TRX15202.1 hypothetical protein FNF07_28875 [Trinickia caryophylli]WQE15072.1 hypothetical protein U0034_21195 [Trinickia caryophylli]SMF07706.1 hypothetical protein SAMN06295900_102321 [Trinickia caryophylli]GLU31195.1 hypothetical protein Busp01_10370 [Trinickia caryophylli]
MSTQTSHTRTGSEPNGWSAWSSMLDLALSRVPSATQWKQAASALLDANQQLSERMQATQQQWLSEWHERADTPGFVEFCRQCGDTSHELSKRLIDWQLQGTAQWRSQVYALTAQLLSSRGEGDNLLALCAAQQAARKQWDEQGAALAQWFGGVSPAFTQCLQLWLDSGADASLVPQAAADRPG